MLLVKEVSIRCRFAMRILCYLSHRSFFELALDPISLWDMEEASSCQSGDWWRFWRHQCSCSMQLTTGKKREELFSCCWFGGFFWSGFIFILKSSLWQLTPGFDSRFLVEQRMWFYLESSPKFWFCLFYSRWMTY